MAPGQKKVAAFFDFDGILFFPDISWQVRDSSLGIIGSAITWEEACLKLNLLRKEKSKLKLQKLYRFPTTEWDTVSLRNSDNVTPPEYLPELVRRHENLQHDLYLISQGDCEEFLELIDFPSPKNSKTLVKAKPFEGIPFYSLPVVKVRKMSTEFYAKEKLYQILNFLRRVGGKESQPHKESLTKKRPKEIYDQIFLYHTQKEYQKVVKEALKKHKEDFSSKSMALIPSYIAKVK